MSALSAGRAGAVIHTPANQKPQLKPARVDGGGDMAADDKYLQFPLSLLGLPVTGKTETEIGRERMSAILHYAIVEHGRKMSADMTVDDLREFADEIEDGDLPVGLSRNKREHLEYVHGGKRLGVCKGSIPRAFELHKLCTEHSRQQAARHGRDAVCRMRHDLVFKTMNGGMTWRDFSTLAAVYSVIGDKDFPVLIRRTLIQARQAGYKSPAVMKTENAKPLTLDQIRYTLDSLENAGCFCRIQASRKCVYFTHRMTRKAATEALTRKAIVKARTVANRSLDRQFQSELALIKKWEK